jgi:UDP-glucuronate decarboxylase
MSASHEQGTKVLISGGAGFIGKNLALSLLSSGFHVTCLDDFKCSSRNGIRHLRHHKNFDFVEHDICEPISLDCDIIFNLASIPSPANYLVDPIRTGLVNFVGTKNMLDLASTTRAIFVQASTSEVYGDPEEHPQRETYVGRLDPQSRRACYSETKRAAETMCFDYKRQKGVDVRVARIFNTYGPMMSSNDGRVIADFICKALSGSPLAIHGDGSQTRSFCYIDDLVSGLRLIAKRAITLEGPINLGSQDERSIVSLAHLVLQYTSSKSELARIERTQDDPIRRQPCLKLAHSLLGWSPSTDLENGLKKTIEYFQNN